MEKNNMQLLVDGMSGKWQKERANSQMTLGRFIEILKSMPKNKKIDGLQYQIDLLQNDQTINPSSSNNDIYNITYYYNNKIQ